MARPHDWAKLYTEVDEEDTTGKGRAFPDLFPEEDAFDDLLRETVGVAAAPREGLVRNHTAPCRTCGEIHPYMTGTLELTSGERYCGVPVLWTGYYPVAGHVRDEDVVRPAHGMQVLVFTYDGLRLAVVWCPEDRR